MQSRCGVSAVPGGRGRELKKIVQPMGTHHTEQRQSSALRRNSSSPGIADERGTEQGKSSCPGGSPYERGYRLGPGYLFLGIIIPGESKKQSSHLSWLQNHPALDFHFIHLPFKKKKRSLKRDVCHGNHPSVPGRVWGFVTPRQIFAVETWFQWRIPPAGSGGTFVYRLRILHAPLALFLFHVG